MKHVFKIIIAMLIWGSIGIFVKDVKLSSVDLVFFRAIIASGFLFLVKILQRKKVKKSQTIKITNKDKYLVVLSGIILALNWIILFQAYKYTTLTNATLSYYMAPVFIVLLSPIILKEKLTLKGLIAVAMAMVGLALIVSHQPQVSNVNFDHTRGIIFGLIAAVLYASVVLLNKSIKSYSGFDKALIQIFISTLVLLPIIIYQHDLRIEDVKTFIIIVILGVVHTGIAYVLYFTSIEHVKAQRVSLLSYVDPLSAVIFGTLLLGEPIGIFHIVGGALILLSTLISSIKSKPTEFGEIKQ